MTRLTAAQSTSCQTVGSNNAGTATLTAKQVLVLHLDVPLGWELVRPIRSAVTGEECVTAYAHSIETDLHLAIRKTWTWPHWLLCDWIAKDKDGTWCGFYKDEPTISMVHWVSWYVRTQLTGAVDTSGFPDCDWEHSLFRRGK